MEGRLHIQSLMNLLDFFVWWHNQFDLLNIQTTNVWCFFTPPPQSNASAVTTHNGGLDAQNYNCMCQPFYSPFTCTNTRLTIRILTDEGPYSRPLCCDLLAIRRNAYDRELASVDVDEEVGNKLGFMWGLQADSLLFCVCGAFQSEGRILWL